MIFSHSHFYLEKFERKKKREEQLISSALNYKEYEEPHVQDETTSGSTNLVTQSKLFLDKQVYIF
jgi:hypothetical protein